MTRKLLKTALAVAVVAAPLAVYTASHREAPITALDRAADITDWYSFVSYDDPSKMTMVMSVDPLLEPGNGPNYFPFDPEVLYEMHIDNNHDAVTDLTLQFRFQTEQRLPGVFTGFVGNLVGIPPITALDGPGSEGLGSRQSYSVVAIKGNQRVDLTAGRSVFAVPSNVGPRTMPNYQALYNQGIYDLGFGIKVFAGTTDDPFYIDLGAAFDSLNFRPAAGGGVLSATDDNNNTVNVAPDEVSGYNVNTIAIEIPIAFLTQDLRRHANDEPAAVLGTYATTSRQQITVRRMPREGNGNLTPGTVAAGAAHGQPAHQRAHHRHRLQGSLEHGEPGWRPAVRPVLRPAAAGRHLQVDWRARAERRPRRPGAARGLRWSRPSPPARRRARWPTCSASTPASRRLPPASSSASACSRCSTRTPAMTTRPASPTAAVRMTT